MNDSLRFWPFVLGRWGVDFYRSRGPLSRRLCVASFVAFLVALPAVLCLKQNPVADFLERGILAPHVLVALVEIGAFGACSAVTFCIRRLDGLILSEPAMSVATRSMFVRVVVDSGKWANGASIVAVALASALIWSVIVPGLGLPLLTRVSLGIVVGTFAFSLALAGFFMVGRVLWRLFRVRGAILDSLLYVPTERSGGLSRLMRFVSVVVFIWGLLSSLLFIVGQRVLTYSGQIPDCVRWIILLLILVDLVCALGMCAVWARAQWWAHTKREELRSALMSIAWARGAAASSNTLARLALLESARRSGLGGLAMQLTAEFASVLSLIVAILQWHSTTPVGP
jgi:hypothetical protein